MKKGAAAKKGKEPEPVPVVEEPPKPTPEELEALAKIEEAKRITAANIARVTFPKLPIKKIVSYHSSTILAQEEPPLVQITDTKDNEIRITFRHQAKERGFVLHSELPEMILSLLHFQPDHRHYSNHSLNMKTIILPKYITMLQYDKHQHVPSLPNNDFESTIPLPNSNTDISMNFSDAKEEKQYNEQEFVSLFTSLFAPSFSYGQHLRLYAGRNCSADVKDLLLRGCAINTCNGEGLSALHIACEHNHVHIIDTLLSMHIPNHLLLHLNLNLQDKYGWTPLHSAVYHGSYACVQKLLSLSEHSNSAFSQDYPGLEGVDIHLTTNEGKSLLHLACMQNRGTIIPLLLAQPGGGSRFSSVDHHGRTPLHDAAYKGHQSLYQEYMQLLSNVSTLNSKGNHSAIPVEDGEVVSIQDALGYVPKQYVEIDDTPKIFV